MPLCSALWFITHLFNCLELPPLSSGSKVKLQKFIAYVLYPTKLYLPFGLIHCLVQWFPTTCGLSGHCLFISTFMLASGKVIHDDMYSIKSWSTVTQQIFQLWEIVQMGRGICWYSG
ncbi:hypothetical protein F5141DRAFT_1010422 [Pisolithus sp. B1]|nr:hypothetical protein F5141DRAFT_1010422 [Pisolithus sp. B1]